MTKFRKLFCLLMAAGLWFSLPNLAAAQYDGIHNSFIVSPAKQEITLGAGESVIRNIYLTNKLGSDADFEISVEDVAGGNDRDEVIKYYGQGLGPYSIRNYVVVPGGRVRVLSGETKAVPVMITLPAGVKPGGLYGGVFVTAITSGAGAGTKVSTRIGSLIFLRVKGEVVASGEVKKFATFTGQTIFGNRSPIDFLVSFGNTGNIYLNPYGMIEIKDYRGRAVDRLPIEPWFVFPDSVRSRTLTWTRPPLYGFFTATLYLNHGAAETQASVRSFHFLILPAWLIISGLSLLVLLFIGYKLRRKIKQWQV